MRPDAAKSLTIASGFATLSLLAALYIQPTELRFLLTITALSIALGMCRRAFRVE